MNSKPKTGSVTIDDVARKAGVSRTTTSLVLRDQVEGRVSSEVVERVRRAMLDMNYRPSSAARQLRMRSTGPVRTGFIGYSIQSAGHPLSDTYYGEVLAGASLEAQERKYHLLMGHTHNATDEIKRQLLMMTGEKVDAWLIGGIYNQDVLEFLQSAAIPAVWVGGAMDTSGIISQVKGDDFQSGYLAMKHLTDLGHRQIACIHVLPHLAWVEPMNAGCRKALVEAQLDESAMTVDFHEGDLQQLREILQDLLTLNPRPTALFLRSDQFALAALQILDEQGVQVPQQLSVLGHDGLEMAFLSRPPLSTIIAPRREIGVMALRRALEVLESPTLPPTVTTLPVTLVPGGTTASPCELATRLSLNVC